MLCVVDVGNSDTCLAFWDKGKLVEKNRFPSWDATLEEVTDRLKALGHKVDEFFIASVVEPLDSVWLEVSEHVAGKAPQRVNYTMKFDFTWELDEPEKVGADRIANAQFLATQPNLPALVIDIGTATTIEIVSDQKAFIGGVITLGPNLWLEGFAKKFPHLPKPQFESGEHVIGKNTRDAMDSGFRLAYQRMLESLVDDIEKEMGTPPTVFITGGMGYLFQVKNSTYDLDLTLKGIYQIYLRNR